MKRLSDNLTQEEIQDRYGHGLSEDKIVSLYPYEKGELNIEEYSGQDYMTTYDPLTAYALRQKYPVIAWGKIKKNHRAFVFRKRKPIMLDF
nr:MAG: hypothetical protein [Bacteriophage sp.]UVX80445.1 MAG: hypothetical protein [Bacteriophage sp.]